MAIRHIRVLPDAVLRQKAKRVPEVDASIRRLIDDMIETMKAAPGVGLAAPQIGVPLRLIVLELPESGGAMPLVNPEVIKRGGERLCEEGCLIIPGYRGTEVKRSEWIKVKALDRSGKEVRIKGDDLLAQILEHEIDHLNGVLYIDRLTAEDKLVRVNPEPEEGAEAASA
ncbi:MAG: peptide deformylase [Chloroflexi bacterium]|nr:peptide deformylase [Chloroflexota bacterium]